MTLTITTGTRPEIIKLFPIMRLLDIKGINYKYIHTGQHYDYEMSIKFVEQFGLRKPDYNIVLSSLEPPIQVSEIIHKLTYILQDFDASLILVQGDTNSVLASALAALKSNIPIAHIEAGLRSSNWRSAEEHNRRVVDVISHILFAPSTDAALNLKNEHLPGKIHSVGNTVLDSVRLCLEVRTDAKEVEDIDGGTFVLVTLHRSENVDSPETIKNILMALSDSGLDFIYPMHPRTSKNIQRFGLEKFIAPRLRIIQPVGYFEFLKLLKKCSYVITDSGGIQEEITSPLINKNALVLRDSTERPESLKSGHAMLCPTLEYSKIIDAIIKMQSHRAPNGVPSPYGCGNSAEKIVEFLEKEKYLP
ncbi:MAG TPA: UDP-N-acetylglucosamine 2-epimerase (non-hydrolyzing) [Nitrososphaeraceae archaeon]|nr:UDP-N-acetylglucosamine 2-epimerase (non-hydrolyzing) [Nitrososphaeraceae archaeon]